MKIEIPNCYFIATSEVRIFSCLRKTFPFNFFFLPTISKKMLSSVRARLFPEHVYFPLLANSTFSSISILFDDSKYALLGNFISLMS